MNNSPSGINNSGETTRKDYNDMKHRDRVDGVIIQIDDGDKSTDDIVELHGELNDEGNKEDVEFALRHLQGQGYEITSRKNGYILLKDKYYAPEGPQ